MQQSSGKSRSYFFFGLLLIAAIIVADQYTKWLVMETMLREDAAVPAFADWFMTRRPLEYFIDQRDSFRTLALAPFLNFTMVWNQGISFGLFDTGHPQMALVFIGISLLISTLLLIALAVTRSRFAGIALALVIGGALGNVIDRVRFGAVADFIDVYAGKYHWPAFNLADSCVVVGALLLVVDSLLRDRKAAPPARRQQEQKQQR
jgi:signal peptidase II